MMAETLPKKMLSTARRVKNKYLNPQTGVRLYARLENCFKSIPEINVLFPYEDFAKHYVYEPSRQTVEHPDVFINQVRYYRLYEFFKKYYPETFQAQTSVVDVGDTSGALLKAMKRPGLALNINKEVIEFIKKRGIEAVEGNVEHLPFADKSFDYTFCFQCLEHLPNPVKALSELGRITRKKIFVSIPYVKTTRIYSRDHWLKLKSQSFQDGGWNETMVKDVDGHKFEFSTNDFKNIVTHADLVCEEQYPINYFSPLGTSKQNEGSYFNFFILKPQGDTL